MELKVLLMFLDRRYGGFTFGLMKDSVPEKFGKNGPTRFRKLAVRHLALVSNVWSADKKFKANFI